LATNKHVWVEEIFNQGGDLGEGAGCSIVTSFNGRNT